MDNIKKEAYDNLLNKYKSRLEVELEGTTPTGEVQTKDYEDFKSEILPRHMGIYEKLVNYAEKIINIKPDPKKSKILQESIDTLHLKISPAGATSLGLLFPIIFIVFGSILAFAVLQSMGFILITLILGAVLVKPLSNLPNYMASSWRMKASNEMILCIFYIVTYMRHTSNLEKAIQFASEHLDPPLSLDMKKIVWDVETEKFSSIKDSLDYYLAGWRKYNMEFLESFHLISSSLLEGDETRRLGALDKALDVILDETYEKMLHYAHNLKSPITMLHMLGVILPILGLVILPLVVSFMEGVNWLHLFFFYNIALPLIVYFLGKSILAKRPTGYGDTDISKNPEFKKYSKIIFKIGKQEVLVNPLYLCVIIGSIFFLLGISPLLVHAINPSYDFPTEPGFSFYLLEYQEDSLGNIVGPFGLGASLLSLFITLAFGIGIGLYFRLRSKNVIKIRNNTKKLEDEFASAIYQLGNRLGDNIPAEMAFGKVAEYTSDSYSGKFFKLVAMNIERLGMSVSQAIFDVKYGAIRYYPSKIIESTMKVMIESIKKGPLIAAQALTNIARYIKEIHRVNERLKDLMAEIVSSMTSQIKFMSPAISGIVVGITSMITFILARLSQQLSDLTQQGGAGSTLGALEVTNIFGIGIPTYYFQIVVGIYVVQIVYILTILSNGIENGADKLNERYQIGKNLINSTILYCIISALVMILFTTIASSIMQTNF